jgi:transposase-like protein
MNNNLSAPPGASKTRTRWTAEERAEWVRLLENSGQGLSEFCRENDLAESTVSLWRKQLREPAAATGAEEDFIEVDLPTRAVAAQLSPSTVTLRMADGTSIAAPVGTDAAWLADLIRQLRKA